MNSLSWMIYLADVAGGLDWLLTGLAVIALIGGLIWVVVGCCAASDDEFGPNGWKAWRRVGWAALLPSFLFGVVAGSLIPSSETVYAIAASEVGETALNSDTGNKAVRALNAWLDRQIAGEPEK